MMEEKTPRRGYAETDERDFSLESLKALRKAQEEIRWLLDRGYPVKNAVTFVCNHYLLSARQRIALTRATAQAGLIEGRKAKEVSACRGEVVSIDGFNLIITLEVALSGSVLIKCMDGTIRDLAGLRGTYRLIDKTDAAIALIGDKLKSMGVAGAVFYLDAPVSNSGRLKVRILELLAGCGYDVCVELASNVDAILKAKSYVATSDGIILDECSSWTNLAATIISESVSGAKLVDLA
ncbi:MAG: DUF434 domain-containing protein [Clostridiales bacterium]|nr:DUF434 domain-containing protein [Clostridiales bacterium]